MNLISFDRKFKQTQDAIDAAIGEMDYTKYLPEKPLGSDGVVPRRVSSLYNNLQTKYQRYFKLFNKELSDLKDVLAVTTQLQELPNITAKIKDINKQMERFVATHNNIVSAKMREAVRDYNEQIEMGKIIINADFYLKDCPDVNRPLMDILRENYESSSPDIYVPRVDRTIASEHTEKAECSRRRFLGHYNSILKDHVAKVKECYYNALLEEGCNNVKEYLEQSDEALNTIKSTIALDEEKILSRLKDILETGGGEKTPLNDLPIKLTGSRAMFLSDITTNIHAFENTLEHTSDSVLSVILKHTILQLDVLKAMVHHQPLDVACDQFFNNYSEILKEHERFRNMSEDELAREGISFTDINNRFDKRETQEETTHYSKEAVLIYLDNSIVELEKLAEEFNDTPIDDEPLKQILTSLTVLRGYWRDFKEYEDMEVVYQQITDEMASVNTVVCKEDQEAKQELVDDGITTKVITRDEVIEFGNKIIFDTCSELKDSGLEYAKHFSEVEKYWKSIIPTNETTIKRLREISVYDLLLDEEDIILITEDLVMLYDRVNTILRHYKKGRDYTLNTIVKFELITNLSSYFKSRDGILQKWIYSFAKPVVKPIYKSTEEDTDLVLAKVMLEAKERADALAAPRKNLVAKTMKLINSDELSETYVALGEYLKSTSLNFLRKFL